MFRPMTLIQVMATRNRNNTKMQTEEYFVGLKNQSASFLSLTNRNTAKFRVPLE